VLSASLAVCVMYRWTMQSQAAIR